MERQKKVIDASIAVKLFAEEENSDKAHILMEKFINGQINIIAPELIFLETLNALRYKKFDKINLDSSNKEMFDFQFEIININKDILDKSIDLVQNYNLTIYDAVYAALAEIHNAQLITADNKLLKTPNAINLVNL